jgi:hypothetical protein
MPVSEPATVLYLAKGGPLSGADRQLAYLLERLDRSRYRAAVAVHRPGAAGELFADFGAEVFVRPMRAWRSFPEMLRGRLDARRLLRKARRHRPDIVHVNDVWRSGHGSFVARRLGTKLVLHVRGPVTTWDTVKHGLHEADAVIAIADRYVAALKAAAVPEERMQQHLVRDLLDRAFGGAAGKLVAALTAADLSGAELAEIRRLLREHGEKSHARAD